MVASNLQRSRLHSVLSFVNGNSMAVATAEHPPGPRCALQHKDPGLCPVACVTAAQLFGHMSAKDLESNSLNPGSTCIWPCWHNCWAQWWLICFSPTYISSFPRYELWIQKCGIIRDVPARVNVPWAFATGQVLCHSGFRKKSPLNSWSQLPNPQTLLPALTA